MLFTFNVPIGGIERSSHRLSGVHRTSFPWVGGRSSIERFFVVSVIAYVESVMAIQASAEGCLVDPG